MLDKIYVNNQCYLDLKDIVVKKEPAISCFKYNLKKGLYTTHINKKHYYARLVSHQKFVTNGELIEKNTKGGYFEIKSYIQIDENAFISIIGGRSLVKLGENSFVKGSFQGTDLHNSFVKKGVKIGKNVLVGMDVALGKDVIIGDKAFVGNSSKIGKKSIIGINTKLECVKVGNKTLIGDNTDLGLYTLDGKCALGESIYIGHSPNYFQYYWWERGISAHDFSRVKIFAPKYVFRTFKEWIYNNKVTRIGANVRTDLGVRIETGATIGDGAKLGYKVLVKKDAEVENESIIPNKTIIEKQ